MTRHHTGEAGTGNVAGYTEPRVDERFVPLFENHPALNAFANQHAAGITMGTVELLAQGNPVSPDLVSDIQYGVKRVIGYFTNPIPDRLSDTIVHGNALGVLMTTLYTAADMRIDNMPRVLDEFIDAVLDTVQPSVYDIPDPDVPAPPGTERSVTNVWTRLDNTQRFWAMYGSIFFATPPAPAKHSIPGQRPRARARPR